MWYLDELIQKVEVRRLDLTKVAFLLRIAWLDDGLLFLHAYICSCMCASK